MTAIKIDESGVLGMESELHRTDRPLTLLADDKVSFNDQSAGVFRIAVGPTVSVQK